MLKERWFIACVFVWTIFPMAAFAGGFKADSAKAAKGKTVYESRGCVACHSIGEGDRTGPDLQGVTDRRPVEWLQRWLKDPDAMFAANDPQANTMLKKYLTKMPNLALQPDEVESVIHYIAGESEKTAAKGAKKK